MTDFNENHQRRLRSTFKTLDERLEDIERLLNPARAQSPFSDHVPDATPVQYRVISDYASRFRAVMRRILEKADVPLGRPHVSSCWAARTLLVDAQIAVEELNPKYMRGYGELSPVANRDLDLIVSELTDLLVRMERLLARGSGRDLRARLERLGTFCGDIALLHELERIITNHGLIELRESLEMLLERIESGTFEVAVFGRVSSGKSSLLNHLLQTDVLPVGVTPVTSVPTRITYGRERPHRQHLRPGCLRPGRDGHPRERALQRAQAR